MREARSRSAKARTATATQPSSDPASEEELIARWFNDPRYFAETALKIRIAGTARPWQFSRTQNLNFEELYRRTPGGAWYRWILSDIEGKGRQRGGSTERLLYQFHPWCFGGDFGPAFVGKIIAFADDTAQKLKLIVELFHDSALETCEKVLSCDPYEIIPRIATGNVHELRGERGNSLRFASEKTRGAGRAETTNALYITDLGEWTNYDEVIAGYAGSLSQTGHEFVDRDFTGKGPGNAAHRVYERMKRIVKENPNGRTRARFFGRKDIDYPPGHLKQARDNMDEDTFEREFPLTEEDMFRGSPNARFKPVWVKAAYEREYRFLVDFRTPEQILENCIPCYGVDSAEGTPESDFSVIKCRCAKCGLEIMPPVRERLTPNETAHKVKAMHDQFPGLINPLRKNHGHAVIDNLKGLGLGPWIYRQDVGNEDDRHGLDENTLTKPKMQDTLEKLMKDGLINMPDEETRMEVTIFGKQKNGEIEAPPGFHDDTVVAEMACVVAFPQALRKHESLTTPATMASQSSSFENFDAFDQ